MPSFIDISQMAPFAGPPAFRLIHRYPIGMKQGTTRRQAGCEEDRSMVSVFCRKDFNMATNENQGGSHEQHVKAGQQSHKNTQSGGSQSSGSSSGGSHSTASKSDDEKSTRGGTHEQHVKAGQQSHKNT
jgi:hypothetical protein